MYGLLGLDNIWSRYNYLKIWHLIVQKIMMKITFKVVQIKSLGMHITNQKLSFDIFTVGNLQKYLNVTWSLLNILMKIDNFDPYNVLLAIATNIPVRLMAVFVVQGHILEWFLKDHVLYQGQVNIL